MPLSYAPGEAAQVDFGAGPMLPDADGVLRRTWAFVMTRCFSRHQYVEFVFEQRVPTWLGCHRRAFGWFGAVPQRIIIDNAKCAITRACATDPLVQRAYAECAEAYGFRIDPCPPRRPELKGVVESGVKYIKRNFLPLRRLRDLTDFNVQARQWVMEVAGVRIHGTTRQAPLLRFEPDRAAMLALPPVAPALGSWHEVKVHRDCHVAHERVLYLVPCALVGKRLWLRAAQGVLGLLRPYGADRLEAACARALAHASPHYRTVKTILAGGYDRLDREPPSAQRYAPGARFVRGAAELFTPEDATRRL